MPVDPMDDIELRSVQLQFSNGRGSLGGNCDMHRVITDKGEVMVAVQGDTTKPAILTYHDLGLNCKWDVSVFGARAKFVLSFIFIVVTTKISPQIYYFPDATSFAGFFNYPTMRTLLENFCVYHVTAPGQEEGAPSLPEE